MRARSRTLADVLLQHRLAQALPWRATQALLAVARQDAGIDPDDAQRLVHAALTAVVTAEIAGRPEGGAVSTHNGSSTASWPPVGDTGYPTPKFLGIAGLGMAEGRPALHGTAPNWFAAKQPETAPAVRAPPPDGAADIQVGTKSDRVSHPQLHCVVATEAAQIPTYTAPRPSARESRNGNKRRPTGQQKPQRGTVLCNRRVDGPYTVLPNAIVQGSDLTPEAFRLLAFIASLPEDWNLRIAQAAKKCRMGT